MVDHKQIKNQDTEPVDKDQCKDTSPSVNQSQSKWEGAGATAYTSMFLSEMCSYATAKIK